MFEEFAHFVRLQRYPLPSMHLTTAKMVVSVLAPWKFIYFYVNDLDVILFSPEKYK